MLSGSGPLARLSRKAWGPTLWWVLAALAIMFLAWQPLVLEPGTGLDSSWGAGLEMAVHNGLSFGNQAIFTFGPLGFLDISPLWFSHLGELSFAYTVVIRFAVAVALFAAARQTYPTPVAFVIAAIVASVGAQLGEMTVVLVVATWAITTRLRGTRAVLLALALGAFAGMEILTKESVGLSVAAMVAVLVISLPARRREAATAAAGAAVITLLACWVAAGQPLSGLPDYVKTARQIVSGYAAAMGIEAPGLGWAYSAAVVALALGVWAAWQSTTTGTARQRRGAVLIWIVFWFFAFKEGFVRADQIHEIGFFDVVLAGFLAIRWRPDQRWAALLGTATLLVFALSSQSQSLTGDFDPSRDITSLVSQIGTVTSPVQRADRIAAGRSAIAAAEPIDPVSLALLRGHTVDVYPNEIALAWAYGLNWRPMPVLQSYAAYTPELDQLDADFLASARAPQRILVQAAADIDARVPGFDQPTTSRAMMCRYRPLYATPSLMVLGRGPNRCTGETLIATEVADWNEAVPVPAPPTPRSLVLVRIDGVGIGGLEQVLGLVWKPSQRFVILNGGPPNRLIAGTAADGLPLRVTAGLDFPAPFGFVPQVKTIAVAEAGQGHTGSRPITYRFYSESFGSR